MNTIIETSNLLLQNSLLVQAVVCAVISEAIIYFGIRRNLEHHLFYISVFVAIQIAIINTFAVSGSIAGGISISISLLIIVFLKIGWFRWLLMKTRNEILMNSWDTLGKIASLNSPLLLRITLKNGAIIYGFFASKSNISFSDNREGLFLEQAAFIDGDDVVADETSVGLWLEHSDILIIELIKTKED